MAEKNIHEKLRRVQLELKVPKSQRNSFGNYNYRSCEDILEAVKPHLELQGLLLIVSDELVCIGDRYYVKATAAVYDAADTYISTDGYAREDETKKGMDGSQITGAASSYARKYAMNGLFAIDDTKDADSNEHASQTAQKPSRPAVGTVGHATDKQRREVSRILALRGYDTPEKQKAKIESMGEGTPLSVGAASRVLHALNGGPS